MNERIVLIAIGVVVAAIVLWPLLRSRARPAASKAIASAMAPVANTDELAELELDREMGRVSEEDYREWRAEIERAGPGVVIDMQVDDEAALARAEALIKRWRDEARPTCPKCGVRPEPAARFCSNCGTSLASEHFARI